MNQPIISKGYFLEKWFRVADCIHLQMACVFIANNVPHLYLHLLPKPEYERWKILHKKSNKVASKIAKMITAKN
jgi:hypothetical protein